MSQHDMPLYIARARRRRFLHGVLFGILASFIFFQFVKWNPLCLVASSEKIPSDASSLLTAQSDTTIVVTSSLIPSHPSVYIINRTIQSVYKRIRGLDFESTKLIIVIDGMKEESDHNYDRYSEMVTNLRGNFTDATILPRGEAIGLSRIIQRALKEVSTKYLYLLQHDLMFIEDIDHNAMMKTMEENPDELQVVRFNLRMNQNAASDNLTSCFDRPSVLNSVNGIHFTRAGAWSDNNQFARKSYYHTLFAEYLKNSNPKHPMEWRMSHLVLKNCSLAPFLYGAVRDGPYLQHLDGRHSQLSDLIHLNP